MMMLFKTSLILIFLKATIAIQSDESCGIVDQTYGLVIGGNQTTPHEFPWSVAIFEKVDGINFSFICGGTLITKRKVITAAHCVQQKYTNSLKKAENFELRLGVYDLNKNNEVGALSVKPLNITIHPEWNPQVTSYDADIAVIELPKKVPISKYIRPICIWERRRGAPTFKEGVVSGWGYSSHNVKVNENIARKLKIPTINNEECFLTQPEFTQLASNRTFCGGERRGSGPCKGDSGSGLVFAYQSKFYLGGIVSASSLDRLLNCDVNSYALYTDVFKYLPWLSGKKFNEKAKAVLACERYKGKRPKRPKNLETEVLPSNEAEIGEFPHMALIGYSNYFPNEAIDIHFGCNGVLISEKFVASTVHCVSSHHSKRKPAMVRLGAIKMTATLSDVQIAVDIIIKVSLLFW